jgi:LEA14-like dessication related protein
MKNYLLVFLVVVLGISCNFQSLKVINPLQNPPSFRFDNEKGLIANVGIYNPNRIGFTVTHSEISFLLNDNAIITNSMKDNIHLRARDTTYFPYHFKFDLNNLLSLNNIQSLIKNRRLKVQVKGYVVASKMLIFRKRVPINLTGEIALPKF